MESNENIITENMSVPEANNAVIEQRESSVESVTAENSREIAQLEAQTNDMRPEHLKTASNHKILPYNSDMKRLKLPEYGRNIQTLIDECVKIEDRDERTRCAKAIAKVVATLLPDHVGEGGNMKKIWDHINIMSDFKLDIDFPCEVIDREHLTPEVSPIPYYGNDKISRHYGRLIESMIDVVSEMEGGEEKDRMISMIANQMKKLLLTYNPTGVSDERVINDLNRMSKGKIAIDPATYKLQDFHEVVVEDTSRNKKKVPKKKVKYNKNPNRF